MSIVSPYVTSYTTETSYITEAEFLATPTALEVTDLIPGGSQAQQDRALTDAIARASSWIDEICHQVLACTIDIERGRYRIDRRGYINVPLKYRPVLEVRGVSVGPRVSQMVTLTDLSDAEVFPYSVSIPVLAVAVPTTFGSFTMGDRVLADVTYVNGWVNTLLAAGCSAGNQTLQIGSLGVYPGTPLTIHDGTDTEQVIVANNYVPGASIVPLAAPLAFDHQAGVSVGNLPNRVKEACVLLTQVAIQTRGNDAIVLGDTDSAGRAQGALGPSESNLAMALDLLETLVRTK